MIITTTGRELHKGLDTVVGAIPHTTTLAILENVKLEVKNGKADLTATNLTTSIKYLLDTKSCDGEGVVIFPAIRANKIASELAESDNTTLSIDGPNCTLKTDNHSFRFLGGNPNNFPQIPGIKTRSYIEIDGGILASMLYKVKHAALKEVKGVSLNGVLIEIHNDDITMVSASSARLSIIKRKIVNHDNVSIQAIIPVGLLPTIRNFLSECIRDNTSIKAAFDNTKACFWNEKGKILCQLIEGNFIAYENILQGQHDKAITITKGELLSLVKTASYMTNEFHNCIKLAFVNKKLTLSTMNNIGSAELTAISTFDVPDIELYVNPQSILDILSVAEDEITMEFTNNDSPIMFRAGFEHSEVVSTMNAPKNNTQPNNDQEEAACAS